MAHLCIGAHTCGIRGLGRLSNQALGVARARGGHSYPENHRCAKCDMNDLVGYVLISKGME
ncbi:MAG: hypothetical protein DI587_35540 [Variovorax paradoxus]|nr:MAG: hypothetical protein DI583_35540 [Variovorax paradoxus]PZQ01164.1 MAG: hypothetical protein DI587_35540 [Variovorax paradoxus]